MTRNHGCCLIGVVSIAAVLLLGATGSRGEESSARPVTAWRYAPIAKPYHFAWWKATSPWMSAFPEMKKVDNITFETMASQGDVEWWRAQSVWAGGWAYGTIGGAPSSADGYYTYFAERIEAGETAFAFDEWINADENNPRNAAQAEACRRLKEKYPHVFFAGFTDMRSQVFVNALPWRRTSRSRAGACSSGPSRSRRYPARADRSMSSTSPPWNPATKC